MNFLRLILTGIFLIFATLAGAENDITLPSDTKIILQRTGCYGPCPVYTLTIYADGKVEFNGELNVVAKGLNVKTISPEKVKLILAEAERINFFELNDDDYSCREVDDLDSATVTITKEGQTKYINYYHGCTKADVKERNALKTFEDRIDELAEISDWKMDDGSFARQMKESQQYWGN